MSKRVRSQPTEDLPVWPETVIGGKFVRLLETQLQQLRDESAHGNRELCLDDVFVVHLLAFFNPTIRSLRTIEDFSQTRQVQKHLSLPKICKSTLSDFHRLADPERLQLIIDALRRQLSRKELSQQGDASELSTLLKHTIAVDGTFLPAMADVAWAICNKNNHGAKRHRARLDVHLEVGSWLPEAIVVPDPGESEAASAITHIQAGKLYLYDRGYNSFALINAHYEKSSTDTSDTIFTARSHFVIRYRKPGGNSPQLQDACEQELSEDDRAAGVISDRVGQFGSSKPSRHAINAVQLREVLVTYKDAKGQTQTLRLITNLLDVSAATIAKLYRYRWQVELFFRWLKCFGNFNHLISHAREGVLTHFYVTIIACLLMYSHTGFRPSKYLFVLMSQVASGGATLEEVLPILRERERQCELARQSAARRRAKKQA